jgi:hypothetical protein
MWCENNDEASLAAVPHEDSSERWILYREAVSGNAHVVNASAAMRASPMARTGIQG